MTPSPPGTQTPKAPPKAEKAEKADKPEAEKPAGAKAKAKPKGKGEKRDVADDDSQQPAEPSKRKNKLTTAKGSLVPSKGALPDGTMPTDARYMAPAELKINEDTNVATLGNPMGPAYGWLGVSRLRVLWDPDRHGQVTMGLELPSRAEKQLLSLTQPLLTSTDLASQPDGFQVLVCVVCFHVYWHRIRKLDSSCFSFCRFVFLLSMLCGHVFS